MWSERRLRAVEFGVWVTVVALGVVAAAIGAGVLLGSGLLGAKYLLFVVGAALFGVGALAIQPDKPTGEERWFSFDQQAETRVDLLVQRIPPLDEQYIPPGERIGLGVKLLAVGVVALGVSVWLEVGLGVSV